tara:strand:+ start:246 stop:470 length:225 start_codon:yes stop_codon:yes gene_type:complete
MYLKGYVQNIWKRDANGEVVVPYEKTGQQFKVIQTINFTKVMPGESITLESMNSIVADPSVDISIVEAPRPNNK